MDGTNQTVVQQIKIPRPQLWSPDSPALYTVKSRLSAGATACGRNGNAVRNSHDALSIPTRASSSTATPLKLKGVCIHHDAGCSGRGRAGQGAGAPAAPDEGTGRQRHSHQPQSARARSCWTCATGWGCWSRTRPLTSSRRAKNKWVDGRNDGAAEPLRLWRDLRGVVGPRLAGHGAPRPQSSRA